MIIMKGICTMDLFNTNEIIKKLKKYYLSFVSNLIVGIITYLPLAIYLPYNSDTLAIGENKNTFGFYIMSSGRLFRSILERISNAMGLNITVPVFQVVIGLILLSTSVMIISYLLNIHNIVSQLFIGAIIVLSCYSEMFLFIHDIIAYSLSILLALIALVIVVNTDLEQSTKRAQIIIRALVSSLILSIAVGIYQISIIYFLATYILIVIQRIYENENNKDIINNLLFVFCICLFVAIFYMASIKLVNSNVLLSRGGLPGITKLFKVYGSIFALPFVTYAGINYSIIVKLAIAVVYVGIAISLIKIWLKSDFLNKIILIVLVIAFPIVINVAMLLEANTSFRTLHGMIFLIIIPIFMIDNFSIVIKWKKVIYISLTLIIFFNFYYTESRILAENNACESTKAYLIEMVSHIKSLENYNPKQKVALVTSSGAFNLNNLEDYHSYSHYFGNITYKSCLLTQWGVDEAFKRYAGYNIKLADKDEINKIKENTDYKDMKTYPYYNSIRIIDDVIVVKLE